MCFWFLKSPKLGQALKAQSKNDITNSQFLQVTVSACIRVSVSLLSVCLCPQAQQDELKVAQGQAETEGAMKEHLQREVEAVAEEGNGRPK